MKRVITLLLWCLVALFCAAICKGDDMRPDAPVPHAVEAPKRESRPMWDKANKIELGVMVGAATWDQAQTCHFLANGRREEWMTQNCGKNVALTIGYIGVAVGAAWLLHKTGHRKLERIPMAYMAVNSFSGAIWTDKRGGGFWK